MTSPSTAHDLIGALRPGRAWGPVSVLESTGSTNGDVADAGQDWAVVVAHRQTAGRGRRGRRWADGEGRGVACSVLAPVPGGSDIGWVPLAVGLAVRDSLARHGLTSDLKWPNDVLATVAGQERKVCGILCEARPPDTATKGESRLRASTRVVVGVGINIDHDSDELPVDTATSLRLLAAEQGVVPPDRGELIPSLLDAIRDRIESLAAADLGTDYAAACATIGRQVLVHRPDGTTLRGTADAVARDGRLVVRSAAGSVTVSAGDVQHIRHR